MPRSARSSVGRPRHASTSWKRRLARFKNRFPQLLRTDYWTNSRRRNFWASLFAREKTVQSNRRPRRARVAKMQVESLEDRRLLTVFAAGSIQGQDGWNGGSVAISPTVHQAVAIPAAFAHNGTGAWLISNDNSLGGDYGSFGGLPFSPALAVPAGQPSSGALANRFRATLFFHAGSTVADGSYTEVDLGGAGVDDRTTFVSIANLADGADGGLQVALPILMRQGISR